MTAPFAYPDRELLLMTLLDPAVGPAYTWLPDGWEPPIIQVQRIGGGPDIIDVTDYALMQVSFYGESRNESWRMSALGESIILGSRGRGIEVAGVGLVIIDTADMDVGGQMLPDLDPDDRRVTKTFTIGCRRQRHLLSL